MDDRRPSPLAEVAQGDALAFQRQVDDVFALLAMAAVWRDRSPEQIAQGVVELLVRVLHLDLAIFRVRGPRGTLEVRFPSEIDAESIVAAAGASLERPVIVAIPAPHPLQKIEARAVSTRPSGEDGIAVVASRRPDFPTAPELLTFRTAVDQGAMAMQSAREAASRAELARERAALERTVDLLTRLHAVSEGLSLARTWAEVAEVVLDQAVAALGASGALLYRRSEDTLERVRAVGALCERRYERLPLSSSLPAAACVCLGEGLFFEDEPDGVPLAPGPYPPDELSSWPAVAAVPLQVDGRCLGAIVLAFDAPRPLPEDDRSCVVGIARQAALAADRVRLLEAERAARDEMDRRKDEFLAMLGHELRNPLAPITTAVHLMRLKNASAFERERVVIERQVSHMTRLVDDLLDISRITHGRLELRRERLDLASVLARAIEMVSPLLDKQQHHLEVQQPTGPVLVEGDAARLAQIFANVLNNAAKYTPPGGHIRLHLALEGGAAVVRIHDDGIGMTPDLLASVFEAFVQERRAIDRSQGGLGLGLAIVKSLVQMHGGTVSVRSEGPARGTEIAVRLPLADAAALPLSQPPEEGSEELSEPSVRQPVRVLVVDDNIDAAEMLGSALRASGYEICLANDGLRAMERARWFAPQIAVLDIGLPMIDGYELAGRLRAAHPGIELVAVTGYGQPIDRRNVIEAGFAVHLVKPVQQEELLRALREREEALQRRERQARIVPLR